jgi:hypothetical protein
MIDPENYIVCGDKVIAVPRSTNGSHIEGQVLQIIGSEIGHREFILQVGETKCVRTGATRVPESCFLFEVERGDAWVSVPPYLVPERAEAKAERSVINTRKRIAKSVPLFSDQIEVEKPNVAEMIARAAEERRVTLEREHELARRSTELRDQVASMLSENQVAVLKAARSRFPRHASYGIYFWQHQLRQIQQTGKPDIYVPQPAFYCHPEIEWLRPDREATWLSPDGSRKVRVLYVGISKVLIKLLGEPITDYDPREYPYGNRWVKPETLQCSK